MTDVHELFQRQTEWQKSRANLSWSEKLLLAELLRDAAVAMRPSSASQSLTKPAPIGTTL